MPLGRIGEPEDIAPVAVFLASRDSHWVTGESIRAAGGCAMSDIENATKPSPIRRELVLVATTRSAKVKFRSRSSGKPPGSAFGRRCRFCAPTNQFGGRFVIPKRGVDPGASLAASALREAFEETGLRARLTGFLGDFSRSVTHVRIYLGERAGGHPGAMGWESQGTVLYPIAHLHELLDGAHVAPLVVAILAHRA